MKIRDIYDKYLTDFIIINRPERHLVWKYANIQEGEYILDVGCGYGNMCDKITRKGAYAYGIDIYPDNIKRAREISLGIFQVGDISKGIKYDDFDKVVSISTLEHIRNLDAAIKNISKALKHGGEVIFSIETTFSLKEKPKGNYPNERINNITLRSISNILGKNHITITKCSYLYKNTFSRAINDTACLLQRNKFGVLLNLILFPLYPIFLFIDWFGYDGYVMVIKGVKK
jgi:SAM-dependent methyltransferase